MAIRKKYPMTILARVLGIMMPFVISTVPALGEQLRVSMKLESPSGMAVAGYSGETHGIFLVEVSSTEQGIKNKVVYDGFSNVEPKLEWIGSSVLAVTVYTGGNGTFDILYDVVKDRISGHIDFVVAIDKSNGIMLIAQRKVWVQYAFDDGHKFYLNYDFDDSAIKSLIFEDGTGFEANGNLELKYDSQSGDVRSVNISKSELEENLQKIGGHRLFQ